MESRPILRFYRRAGCHLCDEGRAALAAVLEERAASGLVTPRVRDMDIDLDGEALRRHMETIPVISLDGRELPLAVSARAIRRFLTDALDAAIA
jgi:hypothetical protein